MIKNSDTMATKTTIEAMDGKDLARVVGIYKAAFAEPPWNERWGSKDVLDDIRFARSQKDAIMLVAKIDGKVAGFCWGYRIPMEKFQFLKGLVPENSSYLDDIAVDALLRKEGVGNSLVDAYVCEARSRCEQIVLRTDVRNTASVTLFAGKGFVNFNPPVYDPVYASRAYFKRGIYLKKDFVQ
jgi:ribosomal protein S18 acetylase RimI-like enzyme